MLRLDCENCGLFDLKGQVRALNDLLGIAQTTVSSLELGTLLRTIMEGMAEFLEMPVGQLALYDKKSGKMSLRIQIGPEDDCLLNSTWPVAPGSLTDHLLRRNEVYAVEDIESSTPDAMEFLIHKAARSLIAVPLVTQNSIHGLLLLNDFIPRIIDKYRISQVAVLASFAAMSIENAKFHEETHRLAINDALTGLNNRRYFDKVLPQEYERAQRAGLPFSLIMLDVDNFKRFNDTHGHHLGDRILVAIGRVLRKSIRNIDFAFRYGGEEFVVILPETSLESAHSVAERIRQRVMHESKKLLGNPNEPPVTVSMGISCYPRDAACSLTLLAMADQLLYQAKKAGRNRVLVSGGRL